MRALGWVKFMTRSVGLPALAGSTMPNACSGPARAGTFVVASVMSVTNAEPPKTSVTRPIRASSLMTGWPTFTPSSEPLSTRIVEYQTVADWKITRPVFGPRSLRFSAPSSSKSLRRRSWSALSTSVLATSVRRRSRSRRRSSTWPLAATVSPNQPNRSRTGFSARLAPSCTGLSTSLVPRCTECSAPPPVSPK